MVARRCRRRRPPTSREELEVASRRSRRRRRLPTSREELVVGSHLHREALHPTRRYRREALSSTCPLYREAPHSTCRPSEEVRSSHQTAQGRISICSSSSLSTTSGSIRPTSR